jgi:hypothetical protein
VPDDQQLICTENPRQHVVNLSKNLAMADNKAAIANDVPQVMASSMANKITFEHDTDAL